MPPEVPRKEPQRKAPRREGGYPFSYPGQDRQKEAYEEQELHLPTNLSMVSLFRADPALDP